MSVTDLPDPILITSPLQLQALAEKLASEPQIAVDTESNSLHAYQEQVCLIQFSVPEKDFLVDPLALTDLSALGPIFANEKQEKIFHAAEYDLICLQRDFDFRFANIFDTMAAARILGTHKVGLGSLLKAEFGVQVNKRHQRANWGKRPLANELLVYARLDTHYLIPLRNRLFQRLHQKKVWSLATEDFRRACQVNGRPPTSKEKLCWRINGVKDLNPRQVTVLQKLCLYRDKTAMKLDRPVFKVLSDRTLLELAERCPRSLDALSSSGMTYRQIRLFGKGVLKAIRSGLKSPPVRPPRKPRLDEMYLYRVDALSQWRKSQARSMGVDSDVVLPRDIIRMIARTNPSNLESLGAIMSEVPWRFETFGESILNVVHKGYH